MSSPQLFHAQHEGIKTVCLFSMAFSPSCGSLEAMTRLAHHILLMTKNDLTLAKRADLITRDKTKTICLYSSATSGITRQLFCDVRGLSYYVINKKVLKYFMFVKIDF